jgi:hypothetical protein
VVYIHNGKRYRSYKHPILEYIFNKVVENSPVPPDEIPFTYENIRQAMAALQIKRDSQASISNFVIDLLRKANTIEQRVPDTISQQGYDLDRMPERKVREGYAGRLVRIELKARDPWIIWQEIPDEDVITVLNTVPESVKPYLGNDEGALLSVMDYCDILSQALNDAPGTIKRVQHPKKWQPGEVDGLYFCDAEEPGILYPVEAKALSTGDSVNRAQIEGAYQTIKNKISDTKIIPLAVQMIPEGMFIAVFEETPEGSLVITRSLKVKIEPPIQSWQKSKRAGGKSGNL